MPDVILDLPNYTSEMKRGLIDKAYFIDKLPDADVFVDFGCGDGALIGFLLSIFPEFKFVGYDTSPQMIEAASGKCPGVPLFSDWEAVLGHLREVQAGRRIAVVLNSVIHEVYSYGTRQSVTEFWRQVFDPIFHYVAVRDMALSRAAHRPSDPVAAIRVRHRGDREQLREFEAQWGSIDYNPHLIHFLLKYRYVSNWHREVLENYLPLTFDDLIEHVPEDRQFHFIDHYTLPYMRHVVGRDFGVDLMDATHLKLIVRKTT